MSTTTKTPGLGATVVLISALLEDSAGREYLDTGEALEALAAAHEWLAWIHEDLEGLDLSEAHSPRVYLQESSRTAPDDEGTRPMSVVLAFLPGPDQVRRFAVWFRLYPSEREDDFTPFTVEGDYFETVEEAASWYDRRCSKVGLEPYPKD